eukprot:TRINITY_DN833_c0_g1_i1.p1 TRINITY_DN833_c0_g1~~TRINITY_DN833_c0_g1_i1.p1  ORF type:complete len:152 (-),score=41.80 TRINITY_DN833_c0_g1_i1:48-503(-)
MRQISSVFLCILLVVTYTCASTVVFYNNCGNDVDVIFTGNNIPSQDLGTLGNGQGSSKDFGDNISGNIKNGWQGQTLFEFTFNPSNDPGTDSYDLSVVVGYDTAMGLSAPDGTYLICTEPGCPDAYDYSGDNGKDHTINQTGGTYNLTFCP